jgi:hypothetical protein
MKKNIFFIAFFLCLIMFAGCKDDPEVVSIIPAPIEETPKGE